ncbi:Rrf2 family transcriptional regulator [Limobrevibacterium gyesilva]|uniref:Rrf2 family transcriptional regulator n=1 Tax=Limobrevibacterium gyesilva TaxID=2991712 RepID=A0AA41YPR4_9PROT|nr:Rrf2 family transcriptional regulator [Limobrevibacterium gyesilva]MCW3476471.1 Rrf2 family transcriptional regulator [Limobrevibacterium gyesilva]
MHLSTRGRYAVMAMVELACRDAAHPVTLADIAGRQQLSLCYLEQLFGGLRRAGLVTSARGPGGGYRLARPADIMTIADIVEAVDEPMRATRCTEGEIGCLRDSQGERMVCATHDLWSELGRQIHLFLASISVADVVEGRVVGRALTRTGTEPARLPEPTT